MVRSNTVFSLLLVLSSRSSSYAFRYGLRRNRRGIEYRGICWVCGLGKSADPAGSSSEIFADFQPSSCETYREISTTFSFKFSAFELYLLTPGKDQVSPSAAISLARKSKSWVIGIAERLIQAKCEGGLLYTVTESWISLWTKLHVEITHSTVQFHKGL